MMISTHQTLDTWLDTKEPTSQGLQTNYRTEHESPRMRKSGRDTNPAIKRDRDSGIHLPELPREQHEGNTVSMEPATSDPSPFKTVSAEAVHGEPVKGTQRDISTRIQKQKVFDIFKVLPAAKLGNYAC